MTLVSKKETKRRERAFMRRQAYEHTIAWGFCLTVIVFTFGMIFWPFWLAMIAVVVHIGSELAKCRAGAYDK